MRLTVMRSFACSLRRLGFWAILALAATLSGCNSDGLSPGRYTQPMVMGATLGGAIRHARITISQANGQPIADMETTTDATGTARLYYRADYKGPILVTLYGGSGASYYDPVTDRSYPLPADFRLRAYLPSLQAEFGITPLTELAARQLAKLGAHVRESDIRYMNFLLAVMLLPEQPSVAARPTAITQGTPAQLRALPADLHALRLLALGEIGRSNPVTIHQQFALTTPLRLKREHDSGGRDLATAYGYPQLTFTAPERYDIAIYAPDETELTANRHYQIDYDAASGRHTLTFINANPASSIAIPFGSWHNGTPTANPDATADGDYRIVATRSSDSYEIALGRVTIATADRRWQGLALDSDLTPLPHYPILTAVPASEPHLWLSAAADHIPTLIGAEGKALSADQHYRWQERAGGYTLTLLDGNGSKEGTQPFGSFAHGEATGNPANTSDGEYRIDLVRRDDLSVTGQLWFTLRTLPDSEGWKIYYDGLDFAIDEASYTLAQHLMAPVAIPMLTILEELAIDLEDGDIDGSGFATASSSSGNISTSLDDEQAAAPAGDNPYASRSGAPIYRIIALGQAADDDKTKDVDESMRDSGLPDDPNTEADESKRPRIVPTIDKKSLALSTGSDFIGSYQNAILESAGRFANSELYGYIAAGVAPPPNLIGLHTYLYYFAENFDLPPLLIPGSEYAETLRNFFQPMAGRYSLRANVADAKPTGMRAFFQQRDSYDLIIDTRGRLKVEHDTIDNRDGLYCLSATRKDDEGVESAPFELGCIAIDTLGRGHWPRDRQRQIDILDGDELVPKVEPVICDVEALAEGESCPDSASAPAEVKPPTHCVADPTDSTRQINYNGDNDDGVTPCGHPLLFVAGDEGWTITVKGPQGHPLDPEQLMILPIQNEETIATLNYGVPGYLIELADSDLSWPGRQPFGDKDRIVTRQFEFIWGMRANDQYKGSDAEHNMVFTEGQTYYLVRYQRACNEWTFGGVNMENFNLMDPDILQLTSSSSSGSATPSPTLTEVSGGSEQANGDWQTVDRRPTFSGTASNSGNLTLKLRDSDDNLLLESEIKADCNGAWIADPAVIPQYPSELEPGHYTLLLSAKVDGSDITVNRGIIIMEERSAEE
jgi:hypothetical protein